MSQTSVAPHSGGQIAFEPAPAAAQPARMLSARVEPARMPITRARIARFPLAGPRARLVIVMALTGMGALLATLLAVGALTSAQHGAAGSAAKSSSATRLSELPAQAELAVSRGLGGDLQGFWATATAAGYVAHNASQRLVASFDRRGATIALTGTPHGGSARVALALRSVGYGTSLQTLGAARLSVHENRVSYAWGSLREWYANGPVGIEQGFDVARPPTAHPAGSLTLSLGSSGGL